MQTICLTNYSQIDPNLFLINLDQKIEGFRNFVSSWLYRGEDLAFLVDPGPSSSIANLKGALDELGVEELDYILLTHIHIDHAGGAGRLPEYFPGVKILCHPKGIEHMIDPARLWKGSVAVLGEVAMAYGEIVSVPKDSIFYQETIRKGNASIDVIATPGHAPHHLSFSFKQYLFAGEVAGVYQSVPDAIYARPATPPKFKLEISLSSLEKVIAKKPETICYGHYGLNSEGLKALTIAREQLVLWAKEIGEQLASGEENFEEKVTESLLEKDDLFSNYRYLESDIKKREDYFIRNSIKGMKEYVESKKNSF